MLLDFSVVDVYSIRPTNLKMYQMVKHVVNSKAKVYSNLQDVTNFVVFFYSEFFYSICAIHMPQNGWVRDNYSPCEVDLTQLLTPH